MRVADIPEFLPYFVVTVGYAFFYLVVPVALFRIYRAVTGIPARLDRIETLLRQHPPHS